MKFTLEINLSDAEVEQYGIDYVLPIPVYYVADRIREGNADAGTVRDDNGNIIGHWKTSDAPDTLADAFGKEWAALSFEHQAAIRNDFYNLLSDPAQYDYDPHLTPSELAAEYRRNIGRGNLVRYADVRLASD